ncbi:uridine kinase [Streptomyces sp. N35]|uniref:uridine kinase family protein n=1 Tax=Streptomyces sp. N35 TaxID=2795730 RepID=UPI0018F51473|nr:AAA family ATPase [Streptomyces sp. N35]
MNDSLGPPSPLTALAAELRAPAPSCGPVRLIGIDGHAGSGKSTFARRLAAELDGAPVLALDDIRSHAELFDWTDRFTREVLEPLAAGRSARPAAYDWNERRFHPGPVIEPAPVVLVEGVGAGRRALRPWLARLVWMELPAGQSWRRGRERDGVAQHDFWEQWEPAEERHFAEDPSRPFADALVRQVPEGYEVLPGPELGAA